MGRDDALLKLYQHLIAKRNELRQAVEDDLELSGVSGSVGDEVDAAADGSFSEINSQLAALESRDLTQIEDAILQIKSGKYGTCGECGEKISVARLKALPFTTLCIKCQRQEEAGEFADHRSTDNWEQAAYYEGKNLDPEVSLSDLEAEF